MSYSDDQPRGPDGKWVEQAGGNPNWRRRSGREIMDKSGRAERRLENLKIDAAYTKYPDRAARAASRIARAERLVEAYDVLVDAHGKSKGFGARRTSPRKF